MNKTETISKSIPEEKISACDIMKTNTSKIIQKLESQIPSRHQQYSDLYSEFLHTVDDLYGICYISEKEFFDNLNIDQGVLKQTQEYARAITETYLDQIDLIGKYRQQFIQSQISYLKVYDNLVHVMMDSYAKTLSQFNKLGNFPNNTS